MKFTSKQISACRDKAIAEVYETAMKNRICPCPFCGAPDQFKMNAENNVFMCFGCKASGGPVQFVERFYSKTFEQAIDFLLSE